MSKIVRKAEFVAKMVRKKVADGRDHEFSHKLIRYYNLDTNTSSYSLTIHHIEAILSLEPKSESHYIAD
jgi:hypothetical protein